MNKVCNNLSENFLPDALRPSNLMEGLQLRKLSQKWHIQGTCATTGEGIYEAMDQLATLVKDFKKNKGY